MKRNHILNVRLSDYEFEQLKFCCKYLDCSYSNLIRRELLNAESSILYQMKYNIGTPFPRKEVKEC